LFYVMYCAARRVAHSAYLPVLSPRFGAGL
jgi:hypothetical protein